MCFRNVRTLGRPKWIFARLWQIGVPIDLKSIPLRFHLHFVELSSAKLAPSIFPRFRLVLELIYSSLLPNFLGNLHHFNVFRVYSIVIWTGKQFELFAIFRQETVEMSNRRSARPIRHTKWRKTVQDESIHIGAQLKGQSKLHRIGRLKGLWINLDMIKIWVTIMAKCDAHWDAYCEWTDTLTDNGRWPHCTQTVVSPIFGSRWASLTHKFVFFIPLKFSLVLQWGVLTASLGSSLERPSSVRRFCLNFAVQC